MKRLLLTSIFLFITFLASAQSLYLDIGYGLGSETTTFDGENVSDYYDISDSPTSSNSTLRIGVGPVDNAPIYIVAQFDSISNRYKDSSGYIRFISYSVGPGVIVYPVPFIQFSGGLSYSFTNNSSDIYTLPDSIWGYAANASVALDINGRGPTGFLIGLKYCYASYILNDSDINQEISQLTFFGKYAFRIKDNYRGGRHHY
jgi:hypothetical protein